MNLYINKAENATADMVALDDLFLTKELPTTGGSKMLDGYMSLFEAEVITRLRNAGIGISGKANVGEFGIDLLGETSNSGACVKDDGTLAYAAAEILSEKSASAVLCFDANGSPRRGAAISGKAYIKPTYGTVSRFGTIPVACSGETVSVMADTAAECRRILGIIAGHDDKDGTSLSEEKCSLVKGGDAKIKKIAVAKSITDSADESTKAKINAFRSTMSAQGIEFAEVDDEILTLAKTAWNILMSAELCNNVSRYDGVKYGYRTKNYKTIDELYTNSRTEAFGELLKTTILYGSETLSTDNYMKVYDKALRIRRVISEFFGKLFGEYDAVLLPACSKTAYTMDDVKADKYIAFDEGLYTAPASITGLPSAITGGVQLIGKAFSESALLDAMEVFEKEDK